MDFGDALKNPIVWGGGALVGIFLLVHGTSAGAASAAQAGNAITPTVTTAAIDMNTAALGAQVQLASINAQLGEAKFNADVADHANVLSYLTNIDNNNTLLAQQQMESQAGITNNLITSTAAIVVDQSNNAARLGEAWDNVETASIQANAQVNIAQLQADAQKAASKNNLIGTIVGTIGKIATVGISGATGVPLPAFGI